MSDDNLPDLSSIHEKRRDIERYIMLSLGDQIIDIELDAEHLKLSIDQALLRYRQRTEHSEQETYAFLELIPGVQEYTMPKEITQVTQIHRRGTGGLGAGAGQFEPFSSGFLNTYMLVAGRVGGLATYELFVSYQKLVQTMFGGYINFLWNPATHKLTIIRNIPNDSETVLLSVYAYKPDHVLLNDLRVYTWIQDYALAKAKHIIGEAREKFAQINGPQGGTTLNGTAMKTEGADQMKTLEEQLMKYIDGSRPLSFIIG